ncbi:hypothetical protein [Sphingomonas sp. Leaf33]|uniref:hypothetical protein n=1 Tax=Sphingomonas sp. Leaf33 TaxID=1736215 RepID=UPI0012E28D7A|nr:hypothetical protein [Sphingomonas sp. Leaf33]
MHNFPIAREVTYTDGQRRFRTLLDRCDGCGESFTEHSLKLIADEIGNNAADDNIVFSCQLCIAGCRDAVVEVNKFIESLKIL